MIISKITGGLGNQMFQYSVGRAVSLHHNVPLKLDISYYNKYRCHNGFRLDAFSLNCAIANADEVNKLKGKDTFTGKVSRKLIPRDTYLKEAVNNIYQSSVFGARNLYLDGYWQNYLYFDNIRDQLLLDFTLKNPVSSVPPLMERILETTSVSIHVRRGDYVNHPHIGMLGKKYYQEAVSQIEKSVSDPTYFIFSNEMTWCRDKFSSLRNVVYVEGTESELTDFQLMASCKHNIIANSSYSWWAAWSNETTNKIIIAPQNWLAHNPFNCSWALPEWIQL